MRSFIAGMLREDKKSLLQVQVRQRADGVGFYTNKVDRCLRILEEVPSIGWCRLTIEFKVGADRFNQQEFKEKIEDQ